MAKSQAGTYSSLVTVVAWRNLEEVEKFIMEGQVRDINVQSLSTGNTVLFTCNQWVREARFSNIPDRADKVTLLLRHKADPYIRNFAGYTVHTQL